MSVRGNQGAGRMGKIKKGAGRMRKNKKGEGILNMIREQGAGKT